MLRCGFVFDLDGVIWQGDLPIAGAPEAIEALRARGAQAVFCTNNSTLHRRDVAAKLTRLGIATPPEDVYSAASLAASLLREREAAPAVFLIGEAGLRSELEEAGLPLVEDHERARWVVLGLDRQVTFERIRQAHRAIMGGAGFLATNPDDLLPETDGGSCPGAGALTALLERSTGRRAECHGKPDPALFARIARERGWEPGGMVAVGDRLDTDILAANRFGCLSVLVMTGVTSHAALAAAPADRAPAVVVESLYPALLDLARS
jgi:phosphoglycolate/pyridoxal phosphate phosphatase family enzyme